MNLFWLEFITFFSDNIQDYEKLKDMLLCNFPEEENLPLYFEIADSVLFGLVQVFIESPIYGMKGQIRIDTGNWIDENRNKFVNGAK